MKALKKILISAVFVIGFPTCYHGIGVLLMGIIKWRTGCE